MQLPKCIIRCYMRNLEYDPYQAASPATSRSLRRFRAGKNFERENTIKTSKEAIVGRALLWIPISVLCQLNRTIILFGFHSANFANKMKVNFWITNEILYEIDTHIEYLKLKFQIGTNRKTSVNFVNVSSFGKLQLSSWIGRKLVSVTTNWVLIS